MDELEWPEMEIWTSYFLEQEAEARVEQTKPRGNTGAPNLLDMDPSVLAAQFKGD